MICETRCCIVLIELRINTTTVCFIFDSGYVKFTWYTGIYDTTSTQFYAIKHSDVQCELEPNRLMQVNGV